MKKVIFISLISILIIGSIKNSKGQNLTNLQKSIIENHIDSIFHKMIEYAEILDYDKISLGVDDRYNAGFIVNGSYYTKYDSLIELLKSNVSSGARQNITIHNKKITVLSDSIVLLAASGITNVKLNSNQSFTSNFLWSFVFENINNEWKVIQSHQSQAN